MVKYRQIGTGTTDSTGKATYTYTGKGKGKIDLIASTDSTITNDSILSNQIEITDCLFLGTGSIEGWNGNGVTLENGVVKWTVPSTSQYIGYYNGSSSSQPYLQGATLQINVEISFTKNIRLACYYYNGTSWNPINSVQINSGTNSTATLTSNIPTDCRTIWIRLQSNSTTELLEEGDEVTIHKFEVYPV